MIREQGKWKWLNAIRLKWKYWQLIQSDVNKYNFHLLLFTILMSFNHNLLYFIGWSSCFRWVCTGHVVVFQTDRHRREINKVIFQQKSWCVAMMSGHHGIYSHSQAGNTCPGVFFHAVSSPVEPWLHTPTHPASSTACTESFTEVLWPFTPCKSWFFTLLKSHQHWDNSVTHVSSFVIQCERKST